MSFTKAYDETMGYEGGYAFDPTDRGGETYKGISRRYNPKWKGWVVIDSYKAKTNFFENGYDVLYQDKQLDKMTRDYYEMEYWNRPKFDKVDKRSEELAQKLFDTGVNVGTGRVSKWLQLSLNLLNRNQKYYKDITADGGIGPNTLATLDAAMKCNPMDRILTVIVVHQGEHYKRIMENDKTQERFVGWFDRLTYK